jgi:hypothetical protein
MIIIFIFTIVTGLSLFTTGIGIKSGMKAAAKAKLVLFRGSKLMVH